MKTSSYFKLVEWSDEDQVYVGFLLGLCTGGVCHHATEIGCYKQLIKIAEEWKELEKKDSNTLYEEVNSRTFSGKFNVRIKPELHKKLTIEAMKRDMSLNNYCAGKLAD